MCLDGPWQGGPGGGGGGRVVIGGGGRGVIVEGGGHAAGDVEENGGGHDVDENARISLSNKSMKYDNYDLTSVIQ